VVSANADKGEEITRDAARLNITKIDFLLIRLDSFL